ncbi:MULTISPECIES: phosphoribosyltransferase [unclassified Microbacterium]|uniref:phosphoribosyltransferase n=1 Tax=unclassified Microbacterium TaxID=2609290 RepID=UPI0012FA4649|nr:phosphoribosyltransferase family protein [Microbacterium sp. MAH-37]MVQ43412.1 phosphoribosyltransferase [Microbacterium sp. MAH-37]
MDRFQDRREAGRMLGRRLAERPRQDAVVLGLPRGGVPVAAEVASILHAPLDVLVVRKLGAPGHAEFAIGAVGEDGARVLNDDAHLYADEAAIAEKTEREEAEVERRVVLFREGAPAAALDGRTAIVVDDGVATGATARAGCAIAKARGAASVVLAVPVAAPDSLQSIPSDEVVCLSAPAGFMAVGMHYFDFPQTSDAEVVALLRAARN